MGDIDWGSQLFALLVYLVGFGAGFYVARCRYRGKADE